MSLEQIFYVSQSIAAVAVIASLLYLAQQVRQAERVQRATMQQGRAGALFLSGEDSFLQHEAGMLSDAAFNSYVAGVKFFRAFGNAMLAQTKRSHDADAYLQWRKLLETEANQAQGLGIRGHGP